MSIKHIFFDLDQTLWDFDLNSVLAFKQCFEEQNITLDFDSFIEQYVPINEAYWKLYGEEKITKEHLKYARLRDTFDQLSYEMSDVQIENLSEAYIRILPHYNKLHEGTIELLEYLYPQFTLHIITNGFNEVSFRKIENSGIAKYFDKIITSENAGAKKPNPQVFQYALQQANTTASESLMVGDNIEADIYGALAVGMKVIYYNYNGKPDVKEIPTVKHLLEVKQFF